MDIAWQQWPVKGRGGGPPLLDDPGLRAGGYAAPWAGLRCEHHGGGRVEWIPFVVEDERRDGQLRQKLIFPLPGLRSCCVADDFNRAAWWHDLEWALRTWAELDDAFARDRADLLAGLRDLIPRPTPAGVRDFAAFRGCREAEDQARDEANRAYWEGQVRRHQADDGGRSRSQSRGDRAAAVPDCLAVLGLRAGATLGQIKARHRILVKQHHPDRGGEVSRFRAIQDAYERAVDDLGRRVDG